MARSKSDTADFFCHTKSGRTKMILVSKFGNDGSSFLFNLLEILTAAEGHYFDCRVPGNMMYLASYCNLTEERTIEIAECLCQIGKIDRELWDIRVIWYQKFVDGFSELYAKRNRTLPQRPDFCNNNAAQPSFLGKECSTPVISGETITREEKSIEEKRREDQPLAQPQKQNILNPEQEIFDRALKIMGEYFLFWV